MQDTPDFAQASKFPDTGRTLRQIRNSKEKGRYLPIISGPSWTSKRLSRLVPALILAALVMVYFYTSFHQPLTSLRTLIYKPQANNEIPQMDGKVILFWTKFFETDDFYVGLGDQPFRQCKKSIGSSGCLTTTDRQLFNRSDAVIFHPRDLDLEDMPTHRLPNQRWIFYLMESPNHTPNILQNLANVFNWTMTYRTDSDIFCPYSVTESPESNHELTKETTANGKTGSLQRHSFRRKKKKKKKVAWFVSNCQTSSGREDFVTRLEKLIEVDVYGKCGPLECLDRLSCYEMLGKNYKFYLSFENSLCDDYVTEKFYNALLYNTVPIVFGGANYSKLAPKNSYIDVRNFTSIKDLADYLNYLDREDEEYAKFLEWREIPPGVEALPKAHQPWCDLCRMLHNETLPAKSYSDIHSWWFDQGHCGKDSLVFERLLVS